MTDSSSGCQLSVVYPCLNEAQTLGLCIEKAFALFRELGVTGEVIVADNGSQDESKAIARALGARVVEVPTRGYGAALKGGIEAALGTVIIMADADGTYDMEEARAMVPLVMNGADLVIGDRLHGRIVQGAMPWLHRYVGTPVLTCLINGLYGARYGDINSGFRVFTKEFARSVAMASDGMEFASEMLVKAARLSITMAQVPITLHKSCRQPHLRPWRDGWRHLCCILAHWGWQPQRSPQG